MPLGLFLLVAECCYYACLGVLLALVVTLPFWVACAYLRWRARRRAVARRALPERSLHEVDPDRSRARKTAHAFRLIVEDSDPRGSGLREVAWRGAYLIGKQQRRKPQVLKPRRGHRLRPRVR